MIKVMLTEYEMEMCALVGRDRYASARLRGRNPGLGPTGRGISVGDNAGDVRGAQCEYAAAIGLNLFWRPFVGDITQKDAGGIVQVRSTDLDRGRMIVPADADDSDPYVLVRQSGRLHELLGWLDAATAKRIAPVERRFGDPGHFIEQRCLRDIYLLKRRVHHGIALDAMADEVA